MNVLVISTDSSINITGGQKFDFYLYNKIHELDNDIKVTYSDSFISYKSKYLYSLQLLLKLNSILKYDYIFINSSLFPKLFIFLLIILLLGKRGKFISIIHHYTFQNMKCILKKTIYKLIEYISIYICDKVILVSPYMRDCFKKDFPYKKVNYLGLAFPRNINDNNLTKSNKYNLLYVGTIEQRKGIEFLIKAISLLPKEVKKNIHLNLVGSIVSNSYKMKLDKLITSLKIKSYVTFAGRVSNEELNNYYKNSRIFVFPSLLEGFGIVLIEAMGYKLPVIAFNNSAIPYTVKSNFNGFLCQNKNIDEFAERINSIYCDDLLYSKLSKGAYETYLNSRTYDDLDNDIQNFIKTLKDKM